MRVAARCNDSKCLIHCSQIYIKHMASKNNPVQQDDKDSLLVSSTEVQECPICYQACVHPTKLPCGHVFCYLCAKGVVTRTRKCAMCRHIVPMTYLESPDLLDQTHLEVKEQSDDHIAWFYQARSRGWWLYEKRIATELEQRFKQDEEAVFDLQIAGFIYTIDLKTMEQYRKDDRNIRRAIKRDLIRHVELKGQAGIRLGEQTNSSPTDQQTNDSPTDSANSTNSMQTTQVTRQNPLDLSQLISDLGLSDDNSSNHSDEPESLV